jgi:hypothetical protein
MKKNAVLLLFILLSAGSCGPPKLDIQKYDNKISSLFDSFANVYSDYMLKTNYGKPQVIEDYRNYSCNNILSHIEEANKIEPFEGDSEYAGALKNYLLTVQKTMQEQDGQKIKLLMKDSLMTKEDSLKVKELTAQSVVLNNQAYLKFIAAQKKFREKYALKPDEEQQ